MKFRLSLCVYVLCCLAVNLLAQDSSDRAALQQATKVIRPDQIRAHMRFLSDNLLQGRAPGTLGYDIAARYVATELEGMGLHPGASGNWYQPVPLANAITDAAASSVVLTVNGKEQKLTDAKDYVLSTWFASPAKGSTKAAADVSAPVVFVGFGVTAPDQKYDEFAGVDVNGKIVASIYGAPASFPSTERAYYSDTTLSIYLPEDWKRWPWDWTVPQIQVGEMHWLNKNGVPHDFFPELRGMHFLANKARNCCLRVLLRAWKKYSLRLAPAGHRHLRYR